jgi:hypothetical protein
MSCIIGEYCRTHGFIHGGEADELREKLTKLANEFGGSTRRRILGVLDDVDARDSCEPIPVAVPPETPQPDLRALIAEEIDAHGGNSTTNYCWWCHYDVNGTDGQKQDHSVGCWLMRARAALSVESVPPAPKPQDDRICHEDPHHPGIFHHVTSGGCQCGAFPGGVSEFISNVPMFAPPAPKGEK